MGSVRAPRGTAGVHRHSEGLGSPGVFRGARNTAREARALPMHAVPLFSPFLSLLISERWYPVFLVGLLWLDVIGGWKPPFLAAWVPS